MDLKEMIRTVVREELTAMLPTPTEQAEVTSDRERFEAFLASAEGRVQNLVNETESKVAVAVAAVRTLGGKE